MPPAEVGDRVAVRGDQGRRLQAGELGDEQLLRRVAHFARIVDHQGLRMHRLQEEGGVDVGHVERRVLAQQDDVELGQLGPAIGAQRRVAALGPLHGNVAAAGEHPAIFHGERVGDVDEQAVSARLGRFHHQEGRVALDVDPLDGIHLHRDLQRHGALPTAQVAGHRPRGRRAPVAIKLAPAA